MVQIQIDKKSLLCIFVKAPLAGKVKTRLLPQLSPVQAAGLYQVMTEELIANLRHQSQFDLAVFFTPLQEKNQIINWLGNNTFYIDQQGDDLGQRMYHAFIWGFNKGYKEIIVIGSDTPSLNVKSVIQGFGLLQKKDLVLGPSSDGGYYCIGMKKNHEDLFKEITWSSSKVLDQTLKKAVQFDLTYSLLEKKNDIDSFDDLIGLYKQLQSNKDLRASIPRTHQAVDKILEKKLSHPVELIRKQEPTI